MTATVGRPARTESMTSRWPGRNSASSKTSCSAPSASIIVRSLAPARRSGSLRLRLAPGSRRPRRRSFAHPAKLSTGCDSEDDPGGERGDPLILAPRRADGLADAGDEARVGAERAGRDVVERLRGEWRRGHARLLGAGEERVAVEAPLS